MDAPSEPLLLRPEGLWREGWLFDPWMLAWGRDEARPAKGWEGEGRPPQLLRPLAALRWLFTSGKARRVPLAVIGPKAASAAHRATAAELGAAIAGLGLPLLTGGRGGVMEAACRGAFEKGGETIAFIPEEDWRAANPYVTTPLATGIGVARNVLIARSALALVAIGGEYGTLSEMAFGMHFDKPVFALLDAPEVPGVRRCATVEAVLEAVAGALFKLPDA